jgi:hypothetical protein
MNANPFEVLKLDPSATEEEIVRRAGQLRQTASDENTLTAVRQAVQSLTGKPEERTLFALLTHPGPVHQWPALDRLEAVFRRPPVSEQAPQAETHAMDLNEVADLLRPMLVEMLADEPLPLEMPPIVETPEEIMTQTLEGLWQVLPFELGA